MKVKTKPAASRREDILYQAERLFEQKGYPASVMRELADLVGIEPSSMYSHFRSKEDILWELAIACADDFAATVSPIANANASPVDRMRAMIVAHVEVVLRNQHSAAVFTMEWRHLTEPRLTEYAKRRDDYENLFRRVIREGVEKGQFKPVEPKFGSLTILSALNWTYQWYKPTGASQPREIGQKLAEMLLGGLVVA
jgi:AcrR family transcriptional regulator